MDEFKKLVEVADRLNGEGGCPWDIKQTLQSLSRHLLEEAHEVLEAIDEDDHQKIIEEIGDLFYLCIFLCKIGERQGKFSLDSVLKDVRQKLVRRHPHVFGEVEVKGADAVLTQWEKIKKEEKPTRETPFDDIPKTMGLLSKTQKVIKRMAARPLPELKSDSLGNKLLALLIEAHQSELDAETELRKSLRKEFNAPKSFI